ncbi:hypothetical protein G6F32_016058 [Rhizopus arrhizus]|nr:hypothetical protein G6F32_016058 [Rhizopus arrhizus]
MAPMQPGHHRSNADSWPWALITAAVQQYNGRLPVPIAPPHEPQLFPGCAADAPSAHPDHSRPVIGRLRHRHQRVRQHGPDAGDQPGPVDL